MGLANISKTTFETEVGDVSPLCTASVDALQGFFSPGAIELQDQSPQRWQAEIDRIGLVLIGPVFRPFAAQVAHVAAAIFARIAVEQLCVEAAFWHADTIVGMGLRCKVADSDDKLIRILSSADE